MNYLKEGLSTRGSEIRQYHTDIVTNSAESKIIYKKHAYSINRARVQRKYYIAKKQYFNIWVGPIWTVSIYSYNLWKSENSVILS